jgi:hypothetical protein
MSRRGGFRHPDVILAATIKDRNRMGLREAYYVAKDLKWDGKNFVKANFSEQERSDAALAVCNRMIHEKYLSRILDTVLSAYYASAFYKGNRPLKMKIASPVPATSEQSTNTLSLVFVTLLEKRLKEAWRARDPHNDLRASIECDFNVRSMMKIGRTVSLIESVSREENLINFVGLLAKQPVFAGRVDRDAMYILADDSVRRQSTFANLAAFIDSDSGTIGAATALIGVPESARMQAFPETLKFLYNVLHKRHIVDEEINAVIADLDLFGGLNLSIGSVEQHTLTNLETLLLASYFADATDKQAFEKMLELAGSSRDEKGQISDLKLSRVLDLERSPGTPEGLRAIFVGALQHE